MDDKLHDELVNKELGVMQIYLDAKANSSASSIEEYFKSRIAQGVSVDSIKQQLLDDLENNGPIFGEMRKALKATVHGNFTRASNIPIFAENGIDILYKWVAILVNTCPDCMDRFNEAPKTWEEWEAEGLPQTGATICEQRWGIGTCRCILLPATSVVSGAIKRS